MSRLYVAAKWEQRERAREVALELASMGHVITHPWWDNEQFTTIAALHDKWGVMSADALVFIAEHDLPYKGAYVEFGMAVAKGIPIYILGHAIDECLFTKLPQVCYGMPRPMAVPA